MRERILQFPRYHYVTSYQNISHYIKSHKITLHTIKVCSAACHHHNILCFGIKVEMAEDLSFLRNTFLPDDFS